jgi:hypothetical protein
MMYWVQMMAVACRVIYLPVVTLVHGLRGLEFGGAVCNSDPGIERKTGRCKCAITLLVANRARGGTP